MFVVFPAHEVTLEFHAMMERYRKAINNPLIEMAYQDREIPIDTCFKIVYAAIEDALFGRLMWSSYASHPHALDKALSEAFPGFDEATHPKSANDIVVKLIDNLMILVDHWMSTLVPSRSWRIWHLKRFDEYDIVIEQGVDYRIADWTKTQQEKASRQPIEMNRKGITQEAEHEQINNLVLAQVDNDLRRQQGRPVKTIRMGERGRSRRG